jgi:putative flippase GtrA
MRARVLGKWSIQSIRYLVVGAVSNIILYLLYIVLTTLGVGYKVAMTILFLLGVLQTFFLNKRWTFSCQGREKSFFIKYLLVYGIAYFCNYLAMIIFVDDLGYPHQFVQGGMICFLAIILFFSQKFWVFQVQEKVSFYKSDKMSSL